jgi:hypothetical protein
MVVRAPVITEESIKVDDFVRFSVLRPNRMADLHSDLCADLGGWRNIPIHAHPLMSVRMGKNKGHTGVVLVSRFGCLSSVLLSPHFLQTTSAYTPDLGRLAV